MPTTNSIGIIGKNPSPAPLGCEETWTTNFNGTTFFICGLPVTHQVYDERADKTYGMCGGHASHNTANRGMKYLQESLKEEIK